MATPHDRYDRLSRRRNLPVAAEMLALPERSGSETPAFFSALFGIGVLLLAVTLLVVLGLPAFLDGFAVLTRPQPGLAGIMIGVLWVLRLLSHFDLRW